MRIIIRDWDIHFERDRTRQWKSITWVPVPNKQGSGYRRLMAEKNGLEIFGVWNALIQVASTCNPRGDLTKYDLETLALLTLIKKEKLIESIRFLSQVLDWVIVVTNLDVTVNGIDVTVNDLDVNANNLDVTVFPKRDDSLVCNCNYDCNCNSIQSSSKAPPKKLHLFEESPYFDFPTFRAAFPAWDEATCRYWYDEAFDYSASKGARYKDWSAAVRNWHRRRSGEQAARSVPKTVSEESLRAIMEMKLE